MMLLVGGLHAVADAHVLRFIGESFNKELHPSVSEGVPLEGVAPDAELRTGHPRLVAPLRRSHVVVPPALRVVVDLEGFAELLLNQRCYLCGLVPVQFAYGNLLISDDRLDLVE